MGLISRVSSRTYRRVILYKPHNICTMPPSNQDLISTMWTDFSIPSTIAHDQVYQNQLQHEDDLNNEILQKKLEAEKLKQEKYKTRVVSKKPITIPQPFDFDQRPNKRRFSKASKELDELHHQIEIQEEQHLKIKIRAKKIPKTTYAPFTFVEADRIRKCKFNAWVEQERKNKLILSKEMCNFRAKSAPVKTGAFMERQKELEMYRKIKHYVRVDTLLHESKLPFTRDFHRKTEKLPSI